ncbi:glycoside hydrolase family 13 protein [Rugamonas sp. DEMB1]|uniref:glycoside hydrolase family 13 protein n=1 Tax=Rugamonas sp. DEMB1 TaxID=3039386 RepID=UPI0024480E47|nr:glycoside hydrolase family 13 protein [Rugamonas sp. DEMB1]WGG51497.1 glycoside hydrolase family 13 protein [Rugamonas sp. DEMB1]
MRRFLAAALLAACHALAGAQDYRIEQVEPPFWWTGMAHKRVQLMVHGRQIAELEPSLSYPGARIVDVARVANQNYLFITLELAADVAPGTATLRFQRGARVLAYDYRLRARAEGSAQRPGFSAADVIYQLMPDRFANGDPANDNMPDMRERADRKGGSGRHGGDIAGIIKHLDYIAAQGYTMLWPTPLLESNMPQGSYHGYATTNHYRVDPRYGSNDDYLRLVAQARARGIGVIQDVVLNHIGSAHWWMADLPTPDWTNYQGRFVPTQHHRVAVQAPYAAAEDKRNFTAGWFVEGMPDLNQRNPYVANYLIQNAIWWIEYAGLAGLRVDTYSYSDTAFLGEWSRRLMREYPKLNLVGEEWSPHAAVVAHWQAGTRNADGYVSHMPSMMDFPLADSLRRALAAKEGDEVGLTELYETLSQDHLYGDAGKLVLFEGNHDMARLFSVLHEDQQLYRMALAYVLTAPRIPQIYAGTEIQMSSTVKGRDDASYRRDFPGGWAGDKVDAFGGAGLSAAQLSAQAYLRKLLNWRRQQPVIHHGKTMHFGPEHNTYVYFRYDDSKKVMVAINKNRSETALPTARFAEMLDGVAAGVDVVSGKRYPLAGELRLPPRSVLVLELQP